MEGSHAEPYFPMEKLPNCRSSQQHTAVMQTSINLDTEGEIWFLFKVGISLEYQDQTIGANSLLRTFMHMPQAWKICFEQLRLEVHHVFIYGLP